jgi:hypothetical protein
MNIVPTNSVDGKGNEIMRTIAPGVDRSGREVWVDSDRWNEGRTALMAYNADGSQKWEPGYFGRRARVYHRSNIIQVSQ